jgi:hypothetical protein
MNCPNCNQPSDPDAKYCRNCGAALPHLRRGPGCVEIGFAVLLFLIFVPIGLCGACLFFMSASSGTTQPSDLLWWVGIVAVFGVLPLSGRQTANQAIIPPRECTGRINPNFRLSIFPKKISLRPTGQRLTFHRCVGDFNAWA